MNLLNNQCIRVQNMLVKHGLDETFDLSDLIATTWDTSTDETPASGKLKLARAWSGTFEMRDILVGETHSYHEIGMATDYAF